MAKHMQQQILEAMCVDLVQAGTVAAKRVRFEGRNSRPVNELPAIDITAMDEDIEVLAGGSGGRATLQRGFLVDVSCIAAGDADRETAVELLSQVEECLGASAAGVVSGLLLTRPRLQAIRRLSDDAGAQSIYTIRSIWLCRYITAEGAPRGPAATSHP